MKKIIIIPLMALLLILTVNGLDMCEDTIEISTNCSMVTPTLDCSSYTYDIINTTNESGQVIVDDGTLYLVNASIYRFNFSQPEGQYLILLCDNTTREAIVTEEDENMYIALAIILIGAIAFLLLISYKFDVEFLYFEDQWQRQVPLVKYLTWVICSWLLLALVNLGVKAVELNKPHLVGTLTGVYTAIMWIVYIVSAVWILSLMYFIFIKFVGLGDELVK